MTERPFPLGEQIAEAIHRQTNQIIGALIAVASVTGGIIALITHAAR